MRLPLNEANEKGNVFDSTAKENYQHKNPDQNQNLHNNVFGNTLTPTSFSFHLGSIILKMEKF